MTQTITCPHCHLPQPFAPKPSDPPGEVYCPNCGRPLRWEPPAATRPPTVLCVDDDSLVLHFYRHFLDRHGYRVLTATDGLAGLALAHQDRPDAILLDVMLRGFSGYDICRKFRADPVLHAIPIILVTVWDHASVATTGRETGATLTLQKPAEPETILTALAAVLGQQSGPPAR